jgi:hydroxymethylpyrimidine/phosphomethylpyrimidine kinase
LRSLHGELFFCNEEEDLKKALSIAGSDCSGGAGMQADIKAFSAHGVFGMTVVTSVVAENTVRVIEYQDIRPDIIEKQIDAVFEDIPPDAVKIGMLSCRETMMAVVGKLREWKPQNVVIDPVMYAKNGCALMDPAAISTLISEVVPLADVITPNVPEAEKMADMEIKISEDMREAARRIHAMGCRSVVVKGGHTEGDATDILFDGEHFYEFPAERIDTKHTHGTGCTFSSAIAANLACGLSVFRAVERAKEYINAAIIHAPKLGNGNGPTHHFFKIYFTEEENV